MTTTTSGNRKCIKCGIEKRITTFPIAWPRDDQRWEAAYVKRICSTCSPDEGVENKELQKELQRLANRLVSLDKKREDLLISIKEKHAQIHTSKGQ